jgi:ABC-type amino acid transport substrate-binding protein
LIIKNVARHISGILLGIAVQVSAEDPLRQPMEVRYASPPGHAFLHIYKVDLITRALEITRPEFGDYQLVEFNGDNPNDQRRVKMINEGKLINLLWAPSGSMVTKAEVTEIPFDLLHGLLGYRICLRNANTPIVLTGVNTLEDLRKIRIGQGEEWPDIDIYEANNIKPVLAPSLPSMFEMLGYKRFDCLPFGANEVTYILNQKKSSYPFLEIDDQLLIHYEFKIQFYVSKRYPRIAERLTMGIKKLQENGEWDALFRKYHAEDLKGLNLKNRRVICLQSPYVDDANQCQKPMHYPDEWTE